MRITRVSFVKLLLRRVHSQVHRGVVWKVFLTEGHGKNKKLEATTRGRDPHDPLWGHSMDVSSASLTVMKRLPEVPVSYWPASFLAHRIPTLGYHDEVFAVRSSCAFPDY